MSKRLFMVYDSRAQADFKDAAILERFGFARPSRSMLARKYAKIGAVLASREVLGFDGSGMVLGAPVKIAVIV